ncbi:MAG: AI-2E family transporter, partial [Methylocystis sp.]
MSLERQLLLWGLALAALLALLYSLSSILTPFVAGTVLGYLLNPVADRLKAAGLSRLGAAGLLLGVFIVVVGLAGLLLFPLLARQFEGFVASLPGYLAALQGLFSEWSGKLTSDYNGFLKEHGLEASMPTLDLQKYVNDFIGENTANIGGFARSLLSRG